MAIFRKNHKGVVHAHNGLFSEFIGKSLIKRKK